MNSDPAVSRPLSRPSVAGLMSGEQGSENPAPANGDAGAAGPVRPRAIAAGGLLQADDIMPWHLARTLAGEKCAVITVIGVQGAAPRTIGAQMAVSETGEYVGYLSGGCLERSVTTEALTAISEGRNKLVSYGKGSLYLDLQLPCGSTLDMYIDQSLGTPLVSRLLGMRSRRSLVALRTTLATGSSELASLDTFQDRAQPSQRDGEIFSRVYVPPLKLQLFGVGPSITALARLATSVGFLVEAASPNEATRDELISAGISPEPMNDAALPKSFKPDSWTAAVLTFHDHDWEPALLKGLLATPCFYIGAIGSHVVHARRLKSLAAMSLADRDVARIRGPIGLVPGAKSCASLAVGVVAEIMAEAKARNFMM